MNREQVFSLTVAMVFFYAFSYYLTDVIPTPLLWYFPLEHRWEFALSPSQGLAMGWYGKVLFCLGLTALGTSLMAFVLKLKRGGIKPGAQALFDLLAMSSVLFVLYFMARSLALRVL